MLNKGGVLVIGLDGATFDLLHPLMSSGIMPNLANLMKIGASGALQSTIPPVTGPAWASFQTGTHPGKHGLVDFLRRQPATYKSALIDSTALQGQTLWMELAKYGRRICVLNVPLTYPPQQVNGCMISGFLTPGSDASFTYPPELREQLLAHIPTYTITPSSDILMMGVKKFVQSMLCAVHQKWEAAKWLMEQDHWDLFMVHFQATDLLQHALWDYLDPTDPNFDKHSSSERDLVQRFYRDLDCIIGDLTQMAGDAAIIIMSDHGFGSARKRVYLNRWLANHGYLALNASESWIRLQEGLENLLRGLDVLNLRRRLLPRDFQRQRGRMIRRLTQDPWIDWARTRAFVFSGSTFGNLYLNLEGRDPLGVVPESEYDQLRTEITECFRALNDPDTGQPVVDCVYKREDVFAGPKLTELPDLIVRPHGGYLLETRFKGDNLFGPLPQGITGLHRMNGIYIFSGGPFIAHPEASVTASIVDLAPTILYLLRVPIPDWMDGRILKEMMDSNLQPSEESGAKEPFDAAPIVAAPGYSTMEETQILDRLRGLGYV